MRKCVSKPALLRPRTPIGQISNWIRFELSQTQTMQNVRPHTSPSCCGDVGAVVILHACRKCLESWFLVTGQFSLFGSPHHCITSALNQSHALRLYLINSNKAVQQSM
jgi:hypothetical protein